MFKRIWAGIIRQVRILAVLAIVTILGSTAWSFLTISGDDEVSPTTAQLEPGIPDKASGWGDQMLVGIQEHVLTAGLPIRVANACGLGASSCFRCHSGKRAKAPGGDAKTSPWHTEHKRVNNSCAGCHEGNPRLMKQKIAHKGMIADPRTKPETSCFGCHKSDDAQKLVETYHKKH